MPFFVEEPVRIYTEGPRKLKKVKMRICNICNIEKDITEYNLRKEGKYKYKYCKSCFSIKRKASSKIYYEKNKEKLNEKTKKYYQENKEILNEKNKLYSENNKERRRDILNSHLSFDGICGVSSIGALNVSWNSDTDCK